MPLEFFRNVPVWVWPLLLGLILLGWFLSRDRTISPNQVMIAPAALVPLSAYGVWSSFGLSLTAFEGWACGMAAALALNAYVFDTPREVRPVAGDKVEVRGSWLPMVLILVEFCSRFILGTAKAIAPQIPTMPTFVFGLSAIIGFCGGMFLAQAVKTLRVHQTKTSSVS